MTNSIDRAKQYSEGKLNILRERLVQIVPENEVVVTCGSYARREASTESDIDFFAVTAERTEDKERPQWIDAARHEIIKIVPLEPAEDGAFSDLSSKDSMLHNIGGASDSNHKITRRMLFLLEGDWLFNPRGHSDLRREILERYIGEAISDAQLALFLLNDFIRFYRTMAVDYEFKTAEGEKPKPWGIRNIKLVFSRKLLYASGLFSVAMTADRTREKKILLLENLFELPVIDRMIEICGKSNMTAVLNSYEFFLEKLEEPKIREHLKGLGKEEREDPLFRELKNEGHHFTRELLKLFEVTFDSTHPIRRAVIF